MLESIRPQKVFAEYTYKVFSFPTNLFFGFLDSLVLEFLSDVSQALVASQRVFARSPRQIISF